MDRKQAFKLSLEIIQNTHDGDDLKAEELKLVEGACNELLTERGYVALYKIWYDVTNGDIKQ